VKVPFVDLGPYVELVSGNGLSRHQSDQGAFAGSVMWDLLDSRDFIGSPTSPTVQAFETKLAAKLGANHVVACANGTDALQLALRASGIGPGSRVAMPNLTFFATYEAIVNVGATPVLLDVDGCGQLSYAALYEAHNQRRFDAVLLVHLYGWCGRRLSDFRAFCRARQIPLIEDGAQAFGATVNHDGPWHADAESVFKNADVATLSFYPAKVLGGIGDGGAVVCKTRRTADRVRLLANHGRTDHHEHVTPGWNSRMDSIQALWLTRALDVIDKVVERRCAIFERYWNGILDLDSAPDVDALREGDDVYHNGYVVPIRVSEPEPFQARLRERGIETRRIYPMTIGDQQGTHGAIQLGALTTSREIAASVVCLPVWYGMTDEMVDYVLEAVRG
jgi:UDP-2-acetamido-2-deoxy-ribo-hexuluronate aminotransferase